MPRRNVAQADTLCPLCGKDLQFATKLETPQTLEKLGRHFAQECAATLQPRP